MRAPVRQPATGGGVRARLRCGGEERGHDHDRCGHGGAEHGHDHDHGSRGHGHDGGGPRWGVGMTTATRRTRAHEVNFGGLLEMLLLLAALYF
ncbi:hypothetical protein ZWY2020_013298 [Hordeum vulgare]|nr:hypothetical protein ZWY2020_013298 [Hordeum vulgare]